MTEIALAALLALAAPLCLVQGRRARRRLEARAAALTQTYRARYPRRWAALPETLRQGWPELALERLLQDLPEAREEVRAALGPLRRPLHAWLVLTVVLVAALGVVLWRLLYPA